ncbi:MAG: dihydroneopterin aldolase [Alistipes sp.]|jgi:dihydroneopterin aldolase|nr:dihydroneopterin aldolase [Alistipes sp.]
MVYTINIDGMEFRAHHGCYDVEQTVGGNYTVDVELEVLGAGCGVAGVAAAGNLAGGGVPGVTAVGGGVTGVTCGDLAGGLAGDGKNAIEAELPGLAAGGKNAIEADDVTGTVNYVEVYELARAEMAIPSRIIEHVAHRIAEGIKGRFPQVLRARVTVAKLAPPLGGKAARVAVTIEK